MVKLNIDNRSLIEDLTGGSSPGVSADNKPIIVNAVVLADETRQTHYFTPISVSRISTYLG